MPERLVRFRQTFFDDLDSLLLDERGRDGRPSATDFLLYELPRFETNSPPTSRPTHWQLPEPNPYAY